LTLKQQKDFVSKSGATELNAKRKKYQYSESAVIDPDGMGKFIADADLNLKNK